MIVKLALFLLLVLVALGFVGRLLPRKKGPPARRVEAARKCPACGAWSLPGEPCATPGCRGG
jgi:hypothetical protein